jgi:hypothetical protein
VTVRIAGRHIPLPIFGVACCLLVTFGAGCGAVFGLPAALLPDTLFAFGVAGIMALAEDGADGGQ